MRLDRGRIRGLAAIVALLAIRGLEAIKGPAAIMARAALRGPAAISALVAPRGRVAIGGLVVIKALVAIMGQVIMGLEIIMGTAGTTGTEIRLALVLRSVQDGVDGDQGGGVLRPTRIIHTTRTMQRHRWW